MSDGDPEKTSVSSMPELGPLETVACLRVIAGVDVGRVFRLQRGETNIGRSEAVDVRVEDDAVSRHHAKIQLFPGEPPRVLDLGSMNGTFLNGERVELVDLAEGDRLQVGRGTVFVFTNYEAHGDGFAQRFYDQATRDPVTGLHSFRYFKERLRAEYSYAARLGSSALAVLALELREADGVQSDRDALARHIGALFGATVRAEDVLARQATLSFALLSRDGDAEAARSFAERLLSLVAANPLGAVGVVGVCGLATFERGSYREPEDLWRAAEYRLSLARGQPPGTIEGP